MLRYTDFCKACIFYHPLHLMKLSGVKHNLQILHSSMEYSIGLTRLITSEQHISYVLEKIR